MPPTVSVIVAAHNAESFVTRAVRSACHQSLASLEVIVVNDASVDQTASVVGRIARHDQRVRLVNRQVNGGPSAARNDGIEAARGEWVAVLDADDEMVPDRFAKLLDLAGTTSADIVADNLRLVDDRSNRSLGTAFAEASSPYHFAVDAARYVRHNTMLTRGFKLGYLKPIFRRSMLQDLTLRYDEQIRIGEDYLFCLQALLKGARFIVTSLPLYEYRVRAGSLSSVLTREDILVMIAAQDLFASGCGDAPVQVELSMSNAKLATALRFTDFVTNAKKHRFGRAAEIILSEPSIWPHAARSLCESLSKRAQRYTSLLHSKSSPHKKPRDMPRRRKRFRLSKGAPHANL